MAAAAPRRSSPLPEPSAASPPQPDPQTYLCLVLLSAVSGQTPPPQRHPLPPRPLRRMPRARAAPAALGTSAAPAAPLRRSAPPTVTRTLSQQRPWKPGCGRDCLCAWFEDGDSLQLKSGSFLCKTTERHFSTKLCLPARARSAGCSLAAPAAPLANRPARRSAPAPIHAVNTQTNQMCSRL